jgi:isochorismate hydrolase
MKALDKAVIMIISMQNFFFRAEPKDGVNSQIIRLLQDNCFEHKLNSIHLAACQPFESFVQGFGDDTRGEN